MLLLFGIATAVGLRPLSMTTPLFVALHGSRRISNHNVRRKRLDNRDTCPGERHARLRRIHAKEDLMHARNGMARPRGIDVRKHFLVQMEGNFFHLAGLDEDPLEVEEGLKRGAVLAGIRRPREAEYNLVRVHVAGVRNAQEEGLRGLADRDCGRDFNGLVAKACVREGSCRSRRARLCNQAAAKRSGRAAC